MRYSNQLIKLKYIDVSHKFLVNHGDYFVTFRLHSKKESTGTVPVTLSKRPCDSSLRIRKF